MALDVGSALEYLAREQVSHDDGEQISLHGALANLQLHIEGSNYNASIPADLARGLWEFQEEIYRAVAFALYGVDHVRKLSAEERENFQLVFHVAEGSTWIEATLGKLAEKLGEALTKMDGKDVKRTVIAVVLILACAYGAVHVIDGSNDVKKEEVKNALELGKEKEKTRQFELFSRYVDSNPTAKRFSKATEDGAKAIIKGASDADLIQIGRVTFDKNEIIEANQRAAKERAASEIIVDDFVIVRAEKRDPSVTKFVVASGKHGEFTVVLLDDEFDEKSADKVWTAFKSNTKVKLEVNATVVRQQIKSAQLVQVL